MKQISIHSDRSLQNYPHSPQTCPVQEVDARLSQIALHLITEFPMAPATEDTIKILNISDYEDAIKIHYDDSRKLRVRLKDFLGSLFIGSGRVESVNLSRKQVVQDDPRNRLLRFISNMPVFKERLELRHVLEKQFQFSPEISVEPIDPDTIQINCPKCKITIDSEQEVTDEECWRLDPENPKLAAGEKVTVGSLQRMGTITPDWWTWLKAKQFPTFGPKVILKKSGNKIQFLKGASVLNAIEIKPDGVMFQALWIKTNVRWNIEDFIAFLSKFKSVQA